MNSFPTGIVSKEQLILIFLVEYLFSGERKAKRSMLKMRA